MTNAEDWVENQKRFYSTIEKENKPELEHCDYKMFLKYIKDGDRVLELGCNTGALLQWLKDNKNCDVVGVDVVQSERLFVINRDLNTGLPYMHFKFDVIGLLATIEHLYNDWAILGIIKQYMKPNGYLVISIPTMTNVSINHIRYYPEVEWERLMSITGLKLIEKAKHPDYPGQQHRLWVYQNV